MNKLPATAVLWLLMMLINNNVYAQPQTIIAANDTKCYGGGVNYVSPYYSINYKLSDFYVSNPKCQKPENHIKHGENFSERKLSVDQLVNKMLSNQECGLFHKMLKLFIKARDSVYTHVNRAQPERLSELKKFMEYLRSDLQLEHAALAAEVNSCGSSDISFKIWPYWYLLTKLKEISNFAPISEDTITVVKNDGDSAPTCKNVIATGVEDLEKFYVKIPKNLNSSVKIKFDAYQVQDQFSIYANGEKIHDSNCISGVDNIEIDKDRLKNISELEFRVKAKCLGAEGTVWDIKVNCDLSKKASIPLDSPCIKDINELIIKLEAMMETFYPIQNFYWMNYLCYKEYYTKLGHEFTSPKTSLEVIKDNQCKLRECAPDKISRDLYFSTSGYQFNKSKVKKSSRPEKEIYDNYQLRRSYKLSNKLTKKTQASRNRKVAKVEKRELSIKKDKPYFHKQRYLDNRELYCKGIKNKLTLFNKLSLRYCLTAYPRLLEDNP